MSARPAGATRRAAIDDDVSRVATAGDASRLAAVPDDASRGPGAPCRWCGEPIPAVSSSGRATRRDAETCSKAHRQARNRFKIGRASIDVADRPMRFAYADPPYPGLARRYYDSEEVDHAELIGRLCSSYDGWALSTSAEALSAPPSGSVGVPAGGVLELCPPGARVAIWVKGARGARSRTALNAWEPVITYGTRPRRQAVVEDLHDVLVWGGRQHSHPGALVGMKPAAFCEWVFRLLGAGHGDELDDLFPGSGAITRAWALYTSPWDPDDASRPGRADASRLSGAMRRLADVPRVGEADLSAGGGCRGQLDVYDVLADVSGGRLDLDNPAGGAIGAGSEHAGRGGQGVGTPSPAAVEP